MHKLSANEEKSMLILADKFLLRMDDNANSDRLVDGLFKNQQIQSKIQEKVDGYIRSTLQAISEENKKQGEATSKLSGHFNRQDEV